MQKQQSNTVCIRCGKERVKAKTWQEQIGVSLVTYVSYVCPDESCQKKVEADFKQKKAHLDSLRTDSLRRKAESSKKRTK